jgi:hypothetical protein
MSTFVQVVFSLWVSAILLSGYLVIKSILNEDEEDDG